MRSGSMFIEGALLQRGFWLYVWRIVAGTRTVFYVGRTGDSSSAHAASPFQRAGQHLGSNQRNAALVQALRKVGIDPEQARFEMRAIGPLFPEATAPAKHRLYRDRAAALERALADYLRDGCGYEVLGSHPRPTPYDTNVFRQIRATVDSWWAADRPAPNGRRRDSGVAGAHNGEMSAEHAALYRDMRTFQARHGSDAFDVVGNLRAIRGYDDAPGA